MQWNNYKDEILQLKQDGLGSRKIAKHLLEKYNEKVADSVVRNYLRKWTTPSTFEAALSENNFSFPDQWEYGWIKTKEASVFVKNKAEQMTLDDVVDTLKNSLGDVKKVKLPKIDVSNKKALRAIITDAHVGMESNSQDALFGFEYNESVFKSHLSILFKHIQDKISANGAFDLIIVDDLGDGLDGFNGQTTRGGHHLPQNMSNKEAWSVFVKNKLETCINIIELNGAKKFQFRNVGNDNHAGDFGWTANTAIKLVLEQRYDNVEYIVTNKPMEHFVYGNHCHILTHGKDKSLMMRNWSKELNPKIDNLIRQYIDHYGIKSKFIHLDKGDLHQVAYDRSPKFDYRNFMSFAPPSQWVQVNMGVSYCGFSMQVIPFDINQVEHTDIFFDLIRI